MELEVIIYVESMSALEEAADKAEEIRNKLTLISAPLKVRIVVGKRA